MIAYTCTCLDHVLVHSDGTGRCICGCSAFRPLDTHRTLTLTGVAAIEARIAETLARSDYQAQQMCGATIAPSWDRLPQSVRSRLTATKARAAAALMAEFKPGEEWAVRDEYGDLWEWSCGHDKVFDSISMLEAFYDTERWGGTLVRRQVLATGWEPVS